MNNATTSNFSLEYSPPTPLENFARKQIFKMVSQLKFGVITLQEGNQRYSFGKDKSLGVNIRVHSAKLYTKVLFSGSIGAGEAYVEKLFDVDNLTNLVRILVRNMELLDGMEKGWALLLHPIRLATHLFRRNSRSGSKKNIIAHYDLGNEMYSTFLDESMMYSSAIYPDKHASLEEASTHKLEKICQKLQLKRGEHVLEIGCGWGGFAIYAAENYGVRVTATTISDAQYEEAKKRIIQRGLDQQINLIKKDYRDLDGHYDKLVSIEMIEAVGNKYLPEFFSKCNSLLKRNGLMVLQAITIVDQKFASYTSTVDFIQRHIFPGGCLLSNKRMVDLIAEKTDMVIRGLDDFGQDYARTLQHWHNRFSKNFTSIEKFGYDEKFKRLWEYYLCYCEGGFLEKSISVVQLVSSRPDFRGEFTN